MLFYDYFDDFLKRRNQQKSCLMVKKMENKLSKQFLAILACPECKGALKQSKDKNWLECAKCKRKYEIKEGISVLMPK